MNDLNEKINEMIRKLEAISEDVAYWEKKENAMMIKHTKRRRAGFRARLTRLHKLAGYNLFTL